MNFRNHGLGFKLEELFPYKTLERIHKLISKKLNTHYSYRCEIFRTHAEKIALAKIRKATKLKCFTSFWIGHRNIDIFFPQIGNGLAIEIDGPIHNTQKVMKRDNSKFEILNSMGIEMVTIENQDLDHPIVNSLIQHLNKLDIKDTRSRRRVLTKIYLNTILAHFNKIDISQELTPEAIQALPRLRNYFLNNRNSF